MKDEAARRILEIKIFRDCKNRKFWIAQISFDMQDVELVGTRFSISKLSSRKSPRIEAKKIDVSQVSYSSDVGSLTCATTCVRHDIAGAMGVVSM